MENASKALIIAGAILLAILIIGLGMFIYNQAADTLGSANLSSQQVDSYNSEFLQYAGTRQGSQVKTLINSVKSHNRASTDDPSQQIQLTNEDYGDDGGSVDAPSEAITKYENPTILSAKTYKVTFAYDPNSRLITAIGIVEKAGNN